LKMACATPEGSNYGAPLEYLLGNLCMSKGAQKSWQS